MILKRWIYEINTTFTEFHLLLSCIQSPYMCDYSLINYPELCLYIKMFYVSIYFFQMRFLFDRLFYRLSWLHVVCGVFKEEGLRAFLIAELLLHSSVESSGGSLDRRSISCSCLSSLVNESPQMFELLHTRRRRAHTDYRGHLVSLDRELLTSAGTVSEFSAVRHKCTSPLPSPRPCFFRPPRGGVVAMNCSWPVNNANTVVLTHKQAGCRAILAAHSENKVKICANTLKMSKRFISLLI